MVMASRGIPHFGPWRGPAALFPSCSFLLFSLSVAILLGHSSTDAFRRLPTDPETRLDDAPHMHPRRHLTELAVAVEESAATTEADSREAQQYLFPDQSSTAEHVLRTAKSDANVEAYPRRHLTELAAAAEEGFSDHGVGDEGSQKDLSQIERSAAASIIRTLKSDTNVGPSNPEEHLVTSLPYLDPTSYPTKHYAGHIPAGAADDKKLFYWLFEPDFSESSLKTDDPNEVPLLIWLNGGPACSSMDGLWLENGPFRLTRTDDNSDWIIKINDLSWHKSPAWVLYIDQPVGTGLAFTKKKIYCKNDLEINIDFHYFLEEFFLLYKDTFLKTDENGNEMLNRPFYFSGESHAGHYIPSMMDFILSMNDKFENNVNEALPRMKMPLSGAAIGNGWIDPYHQYAAATAAYGMGLVDFAQKSKFDAMEIQCQHAMDRGNLDAGVCFQLLDQIVAESIGTGSKYKVSQYDSSKWELKHVPRTFPPGHKDVEAYLGGAGSSPKMVDYRKVLDAIHATESIQAGQTYKECTDPPFNALKHQDGLGVVKEIVRVLDHPSKPRLLFFNGMNDLVCNHAGNEKLLDLLPWSKAADWSLAKRFSWDAGIGPERSAPDGYMKQYENLLFLKIPHSGHMVPMDQPEASLAMMRTFMSNGSFQTFEQKMGRNAPADVLEGNPDKPAVQCEECPECPSIAPQAGVDSTAQESALAVQTRPDPSDTPSVVDSSPATRIPIAWVVIGAIVATIALLLVSYVRRRRSRRGTTIVSGDDYDYDLELRESNGEGESVNGDSVNTKGVVSGGGYKDSVSEQSGTSGGGGSMSRSNHSSSSEGII